MIKTEVRCLHYYEDNIHLIILFSDFKARGSGLLEGH